MQQLNFADSAGLPVKEGYMHNALFVTGVGNVGPKLMLGDKIQDMRLVNNGNVVQIELKNASNVKSPFIALVHIVNFIGITTAPPPTLNIVK
jgi:hypothetical protein